jgi:ATP-dependent DNA helicase RecG
MTTEGPVIKIKKGVFMARGQRVVAVSDAAAFYEATPRALLCAVARNCDPHIFRRSPEFSLKTVVKTVAKTVVKTEEKIVALIKENPAITRVMLKNQSGLSIRGVEWNLRKLKAAGVIRRIGPDKGGHWEVLK